MPAVLAQPNRLRRRADFVRVTRTGRRCTRGRLVAHLELADAAVPGAAAPKIGFVVGRTVGGGVVRNAVTRRLRELARERLSRLPAGSSLVVRALPTAGAASFEQLGADLDACLDRLLSPLEAVR